MNKARSDRGISCKQKSSLAKTSDGREIEAAEKKSRRGDATATKEDMCSEPVGEAQKKFRLKLRWRSPFTRRRRTEVVHKSQT